MKARVAVVTLGLVASACGSESDVPEWLRDLPTPVPAATGAPVPVTPVMNPPQLGRFTADPCFVLSKPELAQLSIVDDSFGQVEPTRYTDYGPTCVWSRSTSASVRAALPEPGPEKFRSLTHLVDAHRNNPERYVQWTETSIDGLPVIIYRTGNQAERRCEASIGVADDTMLEVGYELRSEKPVPHWENDPCGAAAKAAEMIIKNLR